MREREERERERTDLNDSITDNVGAVECLLVCGYSLNLRLLYLLPTQTENTETKKISIKVSTFHNQFQTYM